MSQETIPEAALAAAAKAAWLQSANFSDKERFWDEPGLMLDMDREPYIASARASLEAALPHLRAALKEREPEAEVRALEWEDSGEGLGYEGSWFADPIDYLITLRKGIYEPFLYGRNPLGKFATLDEAKSAAQADFATRISSALVRPAGGGWQPIETAEKVRDEEVLLWAGPQPEGEKFRLIGYWVKFSETSAGWWASGGNRVYPTQWQPLPAPPATETGEAQQ